MDPANVEVLELFSSFSYDSRHPHPFHISRPHFLRPGFTLLNMPLVQRIAKMLLIMAPLIGLAYGQVGQVYVTYGSSSAFNATSAAAVAPRSTDYVWHMPLVPLNLSSSSYRWGANASTVDSHNVPIGNQEPYPVLISNDFSLPGFEEHGPSYIRTYHQAENSLTNNKYPLMPNSESVLVLGKNSVLNISRAIDGFPDNQTLTVPFALNLGYAGKCNGSLVFGAEPSYDANRVQSKPWYILPGSENGTLLDTGVIDLTYNVTIQKFANGSDSTANGSAVSYPARLNFLNTKIDLPVGVDACASNFSVTIKAQDATNQKLTDLTFSFPAFGKSDDSFCTTADSLSYSEDAIELGLPFLSVAYILIPSISSPLYVTLPNTYNLPPLPAVFTPNKTLVAPSPPASQAAATTSSVASHINCGRGLLGALGAFMVAVFL